MKTVLRVQELEARLVPAVAIDSAYETYAWVLVNTLRQNPTAFANSLQGLVNGTVNSAFGFSRTDPVISDLKRMINPANPPANYEAALALMRGTGAAGPLAWDELLEDRAGVHNDWMRANGFAHTATTGPRTALPGHRVNQTAPPDTYGYGFPDYPVWGENIGWAASYLQSTKAGMSAYGVAGVQQRAAFLDAMAYLLELTSPSLGHLKNLLGRDSGTSSTLPQFNVFGMDLDLYESPYEAKDGVPESWVSTQRFGLHRPGGSGGYVAGVVYQDKNSNGFYDVGEGVPATVNVRNSGGGGFTHTAPDNGGFSGFVGNGSYSVTASIGGVAVGNVTVMVSNGNRWAEIRLSDTARGGVSPTPNPTPAPNPLPPSRVILDGPVGTQNSLRPQIQWRAVDGATGYQVRINNRTTQGSNLFNDASTSSTNWAPPADLVSGQAYRVYVRAVRNGVPGEWSSPADFSIALPTPVGPTGTVNDLRPTLSWTGMAGASYQIRINDPGTGRWDILPNPPTTATSLKLTADLVSGRTYTWQVRALNAAGHGHWSPPQKFTIDRPTLTGPTTGVMHLRPTLTWTGIAGAAEYLVRINDPSRLVPTIYLGRVTGTNWTPPGDLISGRTYNWQVRALNSRQEGDWSRAATFTVGLPNPTAPSGATESGRPTFSWSPVAGSTQYELSILNVTRNQRAFKGTVTGPSSWTPTVDFTLGHTYRWWVRSLNSAGGGAWSTPANFRVVPAFAPLGSQGLSAIQKRRAEQLTSLFENNTTQLQYAYIEALGDGRGYTAGRAGFTTGTGDFLVVVERYTARVPNNPLAGYLPRLRELARAWSGSTAGLAGIEQAWRTAANDSVFRSVQDQVVDDMYYRPAVAHWNRLGLRSALSLAAIYDAIIQHGDGTDPDGLRALLNRATTRAGGTPSAGVSEWAWLDAFLTVRRNTLAHASDAATRAVWAQSVGRVDVYRHIMNTGNFDLNGPIQVVSRVYSNVVIA